MDIKITPAKLHGVVTPPPSKSAAHRMLIAAALAEGTSVIDRLYPSVDILTTVEAMRRLGAEIDVEGDRAVVRGIGNAPENAVLDCCESGSTLRFLIPVSAALGVKTEFLGRGKLPERPITPYLEEFPNHGVEFDYNNTMPFTINGKLTGGRYEIDGGISSQFITGLLLALPLTGQRSEIVLTSHLESRPYVDMTIDVMRKYGVNVEVTENSFIIPEGQKFRAYDDAVEGDHSQGAFFEVANSLGSDIDIRGLNENSFQGDKKVIEICKEIVYNDNGAMKPFTVSAADIPDLVPILAVLGSFCGGESRIIDAARLRLKESDRLAAMEETLNALGGDVTATADSLIIKGKESLSGGAEVSAHNDHRIAMAMAIAATRCENPIIIRGAECVRKSYPDFWEVYRSLGGIAEEI
ncbi:3-phosphoshikimate 1-carboxyvinyltransferase [Ruminococcus albus]|uniref:3-phosphoshikimate 1-carboxyvinyltransferase n=1 Tax=Ruminococcus albus TaxID=1264 RepID=A0A1H7N2G2_RUMAL|nr:3-phosphoshikimate 1-carboxyvinyltransferase [Ruminococcus albus]SEL17663.1 3-phosphoshikimate 1-carboxyvinyltransferase [Ruminococcus albus]